MNIKQFEHLCDQRFIPNNGFLLHKRGCVPAIKYGYDNYKRTTRFAPSEIEGMLSKLTGALTYGELTPMPDLLRLADFGREVRQNLLTMNPQFREYSEYPHLYNPQRWGGLFFLDTFVKEGLIPSKRRWKVVYFIQSYSRGDRNEYLLDYGDKFNPPWDSYRCELWDDQTLVSAWDARASLKIASFEEAKKLNPNNWIKFFENKCYPLNGDPLPLAKLPVLKSFEW